jgi:hypothetical protein
MYQMSTEDMREWLERNMKIDCSGFADAHILGMHTSQMIIRDDNESDEMRNYALFNYRTFLHGAIDEQDVKAMLTKQEKYRQEMEYGAFGGTLLDDWWSDANDKYEKEQDSD